MPSYSRLNGLLASLAAASRTSLEGKVVPYVVGEWLAEYDRSTRSSDVVTVTLDAFSYLFDVENERLIAAWGVSGGRHGGARAKSRMAGHPKAGGNLYHRGHAIPHTLGGGTDINLVPQLGRINIGPFRAMEKRAVKTPGALYFTYWAYRKRNDQIPFRVEQGFLQPGHPAEIRRHAN
jgi:hypothetical protein